MDLNALAAIREADRWQKDLLAEIKVKRVKRQTLAELLGYTKDALGRRLRGDSAWTIADYGLLTAYFDLVPVGQLGEYRFVSSLSFDTSFAFEPKAYLKSLVQLADLCEQRQYELTAITSDLPIFYFLAHPLLAKCKLLLFATTENERVVRQAQRANMKHFEPYLDTCQSLAIRFMRLTRKEVWGPDPLRSFVHQVERLAAAGQLDQVDFEGVADALLELLDGLRSHVTESNISVRCDRDRSVSSIYSLDSCKAPPMAFISLDNPYFIRAADAQTCHSISAQCERVWARSALVSAGNQAHLAYFQSIAVAIERRVGRLRALVAK